MMGAPFASALLVYAFRALECHSSRQHAVQDYEHEVRDRHDGALFAAARCQLLESGRKYGALFASRCPGALNQGRA